MREYPMLQVGNRQPVTTNVFLGLNQNTVVADGEMNEMRNLSGRSYPMLDQRPPRKLLKYADSATAPISGMVGGDSLVYCRGTKVYKNGTEVTGLTVSSASPKQLIRMGAYVLIFPDKKWFNTANLTQYGKLERYADTSEVTVKVELAGDAFDGGSLTGAHPVEEDNGTPTSGAVRLYTNVVSGKKTVQIYRSSNNTWVPVDNAHVRVTIIQGNNYKREDDLRSIKAGETIELKNLAGNSTFQNAHPTAEEQLEALNGKYIINKAEVSEGGYKTDIILDIDGTFYCSTSGYGYSVTFTAIQAYYPTPDFIMSTGNRLWMCRYKDEAGQVLNEIRASRLGSIFQWDIFEGLSTDGYAMTAGSDGPFSGCAVLKGQPIFFKENCIHRIAGSQPSNFQDVTTMCRGIQEGCWRSAVVVDERLYYKAVDDVMVYDGSIPVSISEKLNMRQYYSARAGAFENLYYMSVRNYAGGWNFFTYSTKTGLWHQQDTFRGRFFATAGRNLYSISDSSNRFILHGSIQADDVFTAITADTTDPEVTDEEPQDWSATFGLFGVDYPDQKYISRFNIRVQLEQDAWMKMEVQYDEDGNWEDAGTYWGRRMDTIMIPLAPRRCDRFQLRLSGGGGRCRIFSISRQFEGGADG